MITSRTHRKNADNPGWYFHPLSGVNSWDVNGVEMLVWGNYCNVLGGATPVNIYYSTDNGQTVKIAYAFGQNPHFRDDGSAGGGDDRHAAGRRPQPGHLPPRSLCGVQPRRKRVLCLHR